jgi:hypothetical protein
MMEIHDAAEAILKSVHDDINGRLAWSKFLDEKSIGYNDDAAAEIRGVYSKALIVLIDEGLCHKVPDTDIVELATKGIEMHGDYKKFHKKKKTTQVLERLRRIAPIASFIIVLIGFIIGIFKKNSANHAAQKVKAAQMKDARSGKK